MSLQLFATGSLVGLATRAVNLIGGVGLNLQLYGQLYKEFLFVLVHKELMLIGVDEL